MALSANTVWEVRTAGNDTNGGGFVTGSGGTDFSQQDAKNSGASNKSTTDAVANGTTTITSATANFTSAIVGNIIYFQGGTGSITNVWRQCTAFTNSTTITIDASIAASTGMTMNIGGALASPGMVGFSSVDGNMVWQKAGTYTVTSTSTNVTNGCVSKSIDIFWEGYNATRGDLGTAPLITADGVITSFTLFTIGTTTATAYIRNVNFDGNSRTSGRGIITNEGVIFNCKFSNFTNTGLLLHTDRCQAVNCWATGCSTQPAFLSDGGSTFINCVADSNTITGFSNNTAGNYRCINCIASNNSGASTDGFLPTYYGSMHYGCVAYNNGRDGFRFNTRASMTAINCIAEGNSGTGFNCVSNIKQMQWWNCAAFNNTTANFTIGTGTGSLNLNSITGTATFFNNAAGGDFTINDTAGGGGLLRYQGFPGILLNGKIGYTSPGAMGFQSLAGRFAGVGGLASRG